MCEYILGECSELEDGLKCICKKGWSGEKCEINICESEEKCYNEGIIFDYIGTCVPLDNDYRCDCLGGWGGRNCEEKVCDGYKLCEPNGHKNLT